MKRKYNYYKNCTEFKNSEIDSLYSMIDNAKEITWRTLINNVSIKEIRNLFPNYEWWGVGLHIKDDYSVGFYKSKFNNKRCYYIRWSSIEYIFIKD